MPKAAIQETQTPVVFWRIAIIDDVYAGPNLAAVWSTLEDFCSYVGGDEDEVVQRLTTETQCNFGSVEDVTSEAIATLYHSRRKFSEIADAIDKLFLDFDQRLDEVSKIESNLKAYGFKAENIKTFQSVEDLFAGEPFQLVFLDLLLAKGEPESREIAKEIYKKFKAFILLMSNSPIANTQQIEGFRRKTRLLKGFFDFRAKSDLCDTEKFRVQIETLPKDTEVCHAIHDFVMALEDALGGPIEEPPVRIADSTEDGDVAVLPQFMHTLRALGLHDYALLCELTLRNEGHPLGDYMMRLLGSHLLAQLFSNSGLKNAIAALDKLRFTGFLPFGDDQSPSFHRMYADATTELITGPWEPHPWTLTPRPAPMTAASAEIAIDESAEMSESTALPANDNVAARDEAQVESEILSLLGFRDDGKELPYVQLGDLLIKDERSLVFAVLSASCELQFVPLDVHRNRPRLRDDTVLVVPGRMRKIGSPQAKKSQTTAGLVGWNGVPYCVDWFDGKLVGIPHCALRKLFQDRGYLHHRRLQTARALELQQAVLSKLSRIGLEVRPPYPRDIKITLYGRQPDQSFVQLGDSLAQAGLLFHGRKSDGNKDEQRVLVLRRQAYYYFTSEMKKHTNQIDDARLKGRLTIGESSFTSAMGGLKLPIELAGSVEPRAINLVDSAGNKMPICHVALRFGAFTEPPAAANRDLMFCLSAEEE